MAANIETHTTRTGRPVYRFIQYSVVVVFFLATLQSAARIGVFYWSGMNWITQLTFVLMVLVLFFPLLMWLVVYRKVQAVLQEHHFTPPRLPESLSEHDKIVQSLFAVLLACYLGLLLSLQVCLQVLRAIQ